MRFVLAHPHPRWRSTLPPPFAQSILQRGFSLSFISATLHVLGDALLWESPCCLPWCRVALVRSGLQIIAPWCCCGQALLRFGNLQWCAMALPYCSRDCVMVGCLGAEV